MNLRVLEPGAFEGVKRGVHGLALGLAALMCVYNASAWLRRRQRLLAIDAVLHAAAIVLEQRHTARHWRAAERARLARAAAEQPIPPIASDRAA